jgi:hypothetical protein
MIPFPVIDSSLHCTCAPHAAFAKRARLNHPGLDALAANRPPLASGPVGTDERPEGKQGCGSYLPFACGISTTSHPMGRGPLWLLRMNENEESENGLPIASTVHQILCDMYVPSPSPPATRPRPPCNFRTVMQRRHQHWLYLRAEPF